MVAAKALNKPKNIKNEIVLLINSSTGQVTIESIPFDEDLTYLIPPGTDAFHTELPFDENLVTRIRQEIDKNGITVTATALKVFQQETAGALAGKLQSPSYFSHRALLKALYPKENPTHRQATPESVSGLT